ncbi:hypothetical protein FRC18_010971 [Serendipita sp. 400]|nr:hypothetical protein FRC18_010971 [Serendipita sp. 400]
MELLSFCLESKSKPEIDIQNTGTNIDKGDQTKGPLALNWISSTRLSRNTCSCLKLFRAEQDVNIYPPSIIPDNEQPSLDFEISTYLQWRRSWEADKALITARYPEAASRTQAYHDNVESLFLYVRPHAHQYIVQMESNYRPSLQT